MSLKGYPQDVQRKFGGPNLLNDPPLVSAPSGLLAHNCSYTNGEVGIRPGFATVYAPAAALQCIKTWPSELGNLLLYGQSGAPGSLYIFDIAGSPITPQLIETSSRIGGGLMNFCQFGTHMAFAAWGAGALGPGGVTAPSIVSKIGSSFVADYITPGPLAYTPAAPTEPGAGVITAGVHLIGYRIGTRSAWIGRPSPDNSAAGTIPTPFTFAPVSFTSAGAKNLSITLNTTWPADGQTVYIIMSPVSNPNRFFLVPGASAALPAGGGAASVTITWSISDEDLIAKGTECTDSLNMFSNPANGVSSTTSMRCFNIQMFGNRAAYFAQMLDNNGQLINQIFVSQPGDYQTFSPDQHVVSAPSHYPVYTGFSLLGNIYLFGPNKTFMTTDTQDVPLNWPGPTLVDGEKGTISPNGVVLSPSGRYGWVADQTGLYYFDGAYSRLPISYKQTPDWKKIFFQANSTLLALNIKDDPDLHKVYVTAFTTSGIALMSWDYTNGYGPDQVMYSIEYIGASQSVTSGIYGLEMVQNSLVGSGVGGIELWGIAADPANTAQSVIIRRTGANGSPARHDHINATDVAIHQLYDTCLKPANPNGGGGSNEDFLEFVAAAFRVKGAGSLVVTLYSYDGTQSAALPAITLSTIPNMSVLRQFRMKAQGMRYRFEINSVDSYFNLSGIDTYYKRWITRAGLGG